MTKAPFTALTAIALATAAFATTSLAAVEAEASTRDSRIAVLCGADHENEVASPGDVTANPDGYYIASIAEQVSLGDPRIVLITGEQPYLCTRSAATPEMDATGVILHQDQRVTRWLFVPLHPRGN